jgi:5S rRNA maturation endonuclease (ribonuclease M5)
MAGQTDVLREILLPKFSELGPVRKTANGFDVCCPVHEDSKPSLSIAHGKTQPVVLDCKAGCEPMDIIAKLGLSWDDLCKPREGKPAARGEWTPHGDAIAVYDYVDESGTLLFQVLRTPAKAFPQRRPDTSSKSGWRWTTEGVRRVLYRLPKIIDAVSNGELIYICEGEKDVHAIEAAGMTATCNPGGAGKWRPEYSEFFHDATVIIVADRDKPGQAHARQIAASLEGIASAVEIAEPIGEGTPGGDKIKDVADHLATGHSLAELVVTWSSGEAPAADLAPDLHEFLAEVDAPYDWIVENILERGDRLIWTGFEGLGKSVTMRQIAVGAAAGIHPFTGEFCQPRKVLWIDCENSDRQGRRHFRKLERTTVMKGRRVPDGGMRLIHRPNGLDLLGEEDAAWLIERVTAHKPDLLYIGPLYRLHDGDFNDERIVRLVTKVLDQARLKADCALMAEHHSPNGDGANRSVRPIGSSLLRRWPELGYGIAPASDDDPCTEVRVLPWRGNRDERHWPKFLCWGTSDDDWPWVVPPDSVAEAEARAGAGARKNWSPSGAIGAA